MKIVGLLVLILFSMPTFTPNNLVSSNLKPNQVFEQLIAEYYYEGLNELDIDSVTIVLFDIKMGEGFDVENLSTRNIVSINQSENSGEFDVLTQDSIAYSFFEDKLTNGYDDYFDSYIRFDGSPSDVRINLGDNNVAHLLESSWFNRSPDFF